MSLYTVDTYPDALQRDIPIDADIWVTFSEAINWEETYAPYYVNISEADTGKAVSCDIAASSNNTVVTMSPRSVLKVNTRYIVFIFGGSAGISSGSGAQKEYLPDEGVSWSFVTGTGTEQEMDATGVDPSGTPIASGDIPTSYDTYLRVIETTPEDLAYHQDVNLTQIAIKFNGVPVLPSGKTWFDYIDISRHGVLG